jgi:hypothetical protein
MGGRGDNSVYNMNTTHASLCAVYRWKNPLDRELDNLKTRG